MIFKKILLLFILTFGTSVLSEEQNTGNHFFDSLFGLKDITDELSSYMETFASNKHDGNPSLEQFYTPKVITIFGSKENRRIPLSNAIEKKAEFLGFSVIRGASLEDSKNILANIISYLTVFETAQKQATEAKQTVFLPQEPAARSYSLSFKRFNHLILGAALFAGSIVSIAYSKSLSDEKKTLKYLSQFTGWILGFYGLVNFTHAFSSDALEAKSSVSYQNPLPSALANIWKAAILSNHKVLVTLHLDQKIDSSFLEQLSVVLGNPLILRNIMLVIFKETDAFKKDKWILVEGEKPVIEAPEKKGPLNFMDQKEASVQLKFPEGLAPLNKEVSLEEELKILERISNKSFVIPKIFLGKIACSNYLQQEVLPLIPPFQNKKIIFDLENICNQIGFIELANDSHIKWLKTFHEAIRIYASYYKNAVHHSQREILISMDEMRSAYERTWNRTMESKQNINESHSTKTFSDIAGQERAVSELKEALLFLKQPSMRKRFGIKAFKGILLYGPPGNGKTLLAKAVANEAGMSFINVSSSDLASSLVHGSEQLLHQAFERGRKMAPAVIFIDEVDHIAGRRNAADQSYKNDLVNAFLQELDGLVENEDLLVIAATNRRDQLDEAFLRPGRIDKQILIAQPSTSGRKAILSLHTKNRPLDSSVSLDDLADLTEGYSGAQLEALVNKASLYAFREEAPSITVKHFEAAIDEEEFGTQTGLDEELGNIAELRKRTIYHELGHASVALGLAGSFLRVVRVSAKNKGSMGGYTKFKTSPSFLLYPTKQDLLKKVAVDLGGRVAEEIFLGNYSSGASSDLASAERLIRSMFLHFGMSESLGLLAVKEPHLLSDQTRQKLEEEVKDFLKQAEALAKETILKQQAFITAAYDDMEEKSILNEKDIDVLWRAHEQK